MSTNPEMSTLRLKDLMTSYSNLQKSVMSQVAASACNISSATPGQFLMLQFMMSTVSQVGQSISNLISQVQSMINNAVRNQKSS
jgi:hypothetical protein